MRCFEDPVTARTREAEEDDAGDVVLRTKRSPSIRAPIPSDVFM
jgi:hypothetical protein